MYGASQGFCALVSIVTVAVISLERAVAVLMPGRVGGGGKRQGLLAAFCIAYSTAAVAPPLFGWSR